MCVLLVSSRLLLFLFARCFVATRIAGAPPSACTVLAPVLSLHRFCTLPQSVSFLFPPQPLQTHSGQLQAVLDIVLSHQGAALKSALMQRLMSALVLPAPEHYRALLRRLAALSGERLWPRGSMAGVPWFCVSACTQHHGGYCSWMR